jgi:hypothetical protein
MEKFQPDNLLPKGTEANLEILTSALSEEASSTGFFNVYPDVDGVVRQANLIIPYGRSKDFGDWDIYASLDVQAVRSYFRLPNEQVVLEYGPVGAYRILFGQSAQVRTDDLGRVVVNFHGPGYTYLTIRLPTSWKRKSLRIRLVARSCSSAPPRQALAICERRLTEGSTTPAWKSTRT